jgi:hypothetical protein
MLLLDAYMADENYVLLLAFQNFGLLSILVLFQNLCVLELEIENIFDIVLPNISLNIINIIYFL